MYSRPVRRRTVAPGCVAWRLAGVRARHARGRAAPTRRRPGCSTCEWWKPPGARRSASSSTEPGAAGREPRRRRSRRGGEARTIRLRIYADRDYRGLVLRWQAKARAQIQRINAVVGPVFNVRFEIESLRDWDRSHVGVPLGGPLIDELEALDDGREVDLVVGLVTPLRGVATSVHHIGSARLAVAAFRAARHGRRAGVPGVRARVQADLGRGAAAALRRPQGAQGDRRASCTSGGTRWACSTTRIAKIIMNPAYDPQQAEFSDYEQADRDAGARAPAGGARPAVSRERRTCCRWSTAMPADEGSDARASRSCWIWSRRRAQQPDPARRADARRDAVELVRRGHRRVQQGGRDAQRRPPRGGVEAARAGHRARARAQGRRQHLAPHRRAGGRDRAR